MRKLRFFIISAAALLMLTACAAGNQASHEEPVTVVVSEDFPHYTSINGLSDKADTVISGKIVDTRVEEIDDIIHTDSADEELNPGGELYVEKNIYTIYTIAVEETFKGNYKPGDKLEFKELGGQIGDITFVSEDAVSISSDHQYVFFLATYADSPASLLNPVQSLYIYDPVDKDEADPKLMEQAVLKSASPDNDLTLSVEALLEIKDKFN